MDTKDVDDKDSIEIHIKYKRLCVYNKVGMQMTKKKRLKNRRQNMRQNLISKRGSNERAQTRLLS